MNVPASPPRPSLLLICLIASLTAACGRGPLVRTEYFALARPQNVLSTTVELEDERRTTPVSDIKERTLTNARELDVRTRGWIYHPALAVYSVNLRPRYRTQVSEFTGRDEREDDVLFFGYTFDTTILQYKPYTVNLYSNRGRSQFDSSLSPDSITQTATDRLTLDLKYDPLPTTISLQRQRTDFEGFNESTDIAYVARTNTRHQTERSASFVTSEYVRQQRELATDSFSVQRARVTGRNSYQFSPDLRLLSSATASQTTTPGLTRRDARLSENLSVIHTPTLRSNHRVNVSVRAQEDASSQTFSGGSSLQHQLYENLTTTVGANAQRASFDEGSINQFGGDLDFRYRRRIPWGTIQLSNGYTVRLEDDNTEATFRDVTDESLILIGTAPSFLENDNVDIDSIVVTNAAGLIIFSEGLDYVVIESDGTVAIARVGVGSGIGDGDTVLVDYRFTSDGPFMRLQRQIHAGVRLDLWRMLTLFYNVNSTSDTLLSGLPPRSLADDLVQRMGADFRWRFSTTRVEYESRDTVRAPLTRLSALEALSFQPLPNLSFGLGASYSKTELTDTGDSSTGLGADARLRWQPFQRAELEVRAFARRTRGTIQRTNDTGVNSRFRWRYGLWSASLEYQFLRQEDLRSGQLSSRQAALLELERRF